MAGNMFYFVRTNRAMVAAMLFIAIFIGMHYVKPSMIYTHDGGFRQFGVGYKHKTVIPAWGAAIALAILSYLAVCYYTMPH